MKHPLDQKMVQNESQRLEGIRFEENEDGSYTALDTVTYRHLRAC